MSENHTDTKQPTFSWDSRLHLRCSASWSVGFRDAQLSRSGTKGHPVPIQRSGARPNSRKSQGSSGPAQCISGPDERKAEPWPIKWPETAELQTKCCFSRQTLQKSSETATFSTIHGHRLGLFTHAATFGHLWNNTATRVSNLRSHRAAWIRLGGHTTGYHNSRWESRLLHIGLGSYCWKRLFQVMKRHNCQP